MTKLMCINEKTYIPGVNNIGDIAGVYKDSWIFTEKEKELFDVVEVSEEKEVVDNKAPNKKSYTKASTTEWTEEEPERKEVWVDSSGVERDIVIDPKYKTRYENGVKENYSRNPENLNIHSLGE